MAEGMVPFEHLEDSELEIAQTKQGAHFSICFPSSCSSLAARIWL